MKLWSVPHIMLIPSLGLLLCPFSLFYFFLPILYKKCEIILSKEYFAFGIYIFLSYFIIYCIICFVKIIIITGNNITILFPFKFKFYKYTNSDIVSYSIYTNYGNFGKYESTHFQTKDHFIFMMSQFEYWNYNKLKEFIQNNSAVGKISKFHNLKSILVGSLISIIMTILTIFLFNQIIKNVC